MRRARPLPLVFFWSVLARLALADDVVPVTDIEEFGLLPPCASVAITFAFGEVSASADCDDGDDKLQSCLCSNTKVSKQVAKSISGDVRFGCGEKASADQSSASVMFAKYCDPDVKVDFWTPEKDKAVNEYITDMPGMEDLAPCASRGLSRVVMKETVSRCPEAASLLAPCVCSKSGVADDVSDDISKSVKSACSNSDDLTAAMSFFGGYCDMSNGTTSFAKPSGPPGDMTYHITALEQFQSLDRCAQTALSSAVFEQTSGNCPSDEQGLASCACLKSGIKSDISTSLKGQVKFRCDSKTADKLSSALDVLELYCSAAEDEVTPTVVESTISTSDPAKTGTGSESVVSETGASNDDDDGSGGNGVNKTAIIAGAVAGGVIAIGLLIGLCIFIRRKQRKANNKPAISPPQEEYNGMPELTGGDVDSTTGIVTAAASPAAQSDDYYPGKPEFGGSRTVVSEVSSPGAVYYKPYRPPELEGGEVAAAEMPSTRPVAEMPPSESIAEMAAVEVSHHHGKERSASPVVVSKYNKSFGRNSPSVRDSNPSSPLSPMHTGGSSASRWRQPEPAAEVFEMEANPVHRGDGGAR